MSFIELRATRPIRHRSEFGKSAPRTLEERQGYYPSGETFMEAVRKITSKHLGEPIDIQYFKGDNMIHGDHIAEHCEYLGTYIMFHEESGPIKLPFVSHTVEGLKSLVAQPV